jgi:hypothetical protein
MTTRSELLVERPDAKTKTSWPPLGNYKEVKSREKAILCGKASLRKDTGIEAPKINDTDIGSPEGGLVLGGNPLGRRSSHRPASRPELLTNMQQKNIK